MGKEFQRNNFINIIVNIFASASQIDMNSNHVSYSAVCQAEQRMGCAGQRRLQWLVSLLLSWSLLRGGPTSPVSCLLALCLLCTHCPAVKRMYENALTVTGISLFPSFCFPLEKHEASKKRLVQWQSLHHSGCMYSCFQEADCQVELSPFRVNAKHFYKTLPCYHSFSRSIRLCSHANY